MPLFSKKKSSRTPQNNPPTRSPKITLQTDVRQIAHVGPDLSISQNGLAGLFIDKRLIAAAPGIANLPNYHLSSDEREKALAQTVRDRVLQDVSPEPFMDELARRMPLGNSMEHLPVVQPHGSGAMLPPRRHEPLTPTPSTTGHDAACRPGPISDVPTVPTYVSGAPDDLPPSPAWVLEKRAPPTQKAARPMEAASSMPKGAVETEARIKTVSVRERAALFEAM